MNRKNLLKIAIVVGAFVIIILNAILFIKLFPMRKEQNMDNTELAISSESRAEAVDNNSEIINSSYLRKRQENLELYQDYNEDVIGWIKIDNTTVDLPIMQTPGDEEYYLRRDLDKKYNSYGLPFLAEGSSLDKEHGNNIIYGHNITKYERAIFADLANYEDIEFYKEHPYVEITTDAGIEVYFIFAYLLVDNNDENPFRYADICEFKDKDSFLDYMYEVDRRNWIKTEYTPNYGLKTMVLSSCSNELFGTGGNRMLVVAQKIKDNTNYEKLIENAENRAMPLLPEKLR